MTTHLFSNTFCKLEISFKFQRLKKRRKKRRTKEELLRGGKRNASIHKQGMQFDQSTTQSTILVQGTKLF